ILIDEARVPLVIAAGDSGDRGLALVANGVARGLRPLEHFTVDAGGHNDALHAHALLRRDVDYIVKNGAIEMVDEFKGRVALDRRWPAGLHTAIEAKEGVAAKSQGSILGQITLQNLVGLYPH